MNKWMNDKIIELTHRWNINDMNEQVRNEQISK